MGIDWGGLGKRIWALVRAPLEAALKARIKRECDAYVTDPDLLWRAVRGVAEPQVKAAIKDPVVEGLVLAVVPEVMRAVSPALATALRDRLLAVADGIAPAAETEEA